MRGNSSFGFALAAVCCLASMAGAQSGAGARSGGTGISFTPYFGAYVPTADLLLRPSGGTSAGTLQKVSTSLAFGGRLGVGLSERVGLEGDVGYTTGTLKLSPLGSPVNTDVKTTNGSLKVVVALVPKTAPLWLSVGGGLSAVHHTFDDRAGGTGKLQDKTAVGGVLGGSFGFRMSSRFSLAFLLDDSIYKAEFAVGATTTGSKLQNDLRFGVGLRIALAGP